MLTDVFESAARVQALRNGPSGPLLDGFVQALVRSRYAPITTRKHLRAAEHFAHWADRTGILVTSAMAPALERFRRHLGRPGRCRRFGHTFRSQILYGARLFLTHVHGDGADEATPQRPPLIAAFWQWMQQQRGACSSTVANYDVHLRPPPTRLGDELGRWQARGLREFVLEGSQTCGWAAAKKRTTALRMFLRFLSVSSL